jgi:S1-C subfamily serine protease
MRKILLLQILLTLTAPAFAQRIEPLKQERTTPAVRVFKAARDAVVNISSTRVVKTSLGFFGGMEEDDNIFQSPFTRDVPVQSLGSGFIIHLMAISSPTSTSCARR